MKKTIKFIVIIVFMLGVLGCSEDLLNYTPDTGVSDASFWKTEKDFFGMMVGTYAALLSEVDNATGWIVNEADWPIFEGGAIRGSTDLYAWFNPTSEEQGIIWFMNYSMITRANLVLKHVNDPIDDPAFTDEVKNRYIGEASFFRGFAYHNLARKYGGVPIATEPVSADAPLGMKRSSVEETWTQAKIDLEIAVKYLPVKWDNENLGRATKGSALGYLGIVKMWMKDWKGAKDTFDELFALNVYDLEPNYRKAFSYSAENGIERLFEIQYRADPANIGWGRSLGGQQLGLFDCPRGLPEDIGPWGGWGENVISKVLCESFEPGDDRRASTIMGPGDTYYGEDMGGLSYTFKEGDTPTGYCVTKYWYGPLLGGALSLGINIPLLRFADILLHYAEVLNELGQAETAYQYINRVRTRALLPDLPASSDKEMCLNAINKERRHEIFHETNFYFDLIRTGKVIEFVKDNYNYDYSPTWLVSPIPQVELDKNPLLVQNPNY